MDVDRYVMYDYLLESGEEHGVNDGLRGDGGVKTFGVDEAFMKGYGRSIGSARLLDMIGRVSSGESYS